MKLEILRPAVNSERTFDRSPIRFGDQIELRHRRAVINKPLAKDLQAALHFASEASESSPYWVGDLLAHAEDRLDWHEKLSQVVSVTGLAEQTCHNLASISRRVAPAEREVSPSLAHASLVAKLPAKDQRRWLVKAAAAGWGKRELDLELKASQKRGVISGTAELEGMFRVWMVDFPWLYKGRQPSKTGAQTHYPGMTVDQGIAMADKVRAHTAKNAVAFFWVTAPFLYYASDGITPDPYRIITSWGFEPKTGGVWDKVDHNFGSYLSIRHEHLIVATRGSCTPDRPVPMFDSVFTERRSDVHSEKPSLVPAMIERLYDGPYVELFARERRDGWISWGNQVNAPIKKAG